MFKASFVLAVILGSSLVLSGASVWARDKKEGAESKTGSVEEQMDNLVKLGPGVHNIKKDGKGRVQSLVVVGQSRISTVLGAAKGKELARKRAEQSAKAAFVKWLGEAVVVCENAENETTLFLQGEESNDKDALSEAGKAVEKSSDTYKSVAAGLVRGLLNCSTPTSNAEDKEYTVVYGWSLANAKSAKDAATNDPGSRKAVRQRAAEKKRPGRSRRTRRSAARRRPPRRRKSS